MTTRVAERTEASTTRLTNRERQILDAASKLATPGDPVSPTDLSERLGIGRNYVGLVIGNLRAKGEWPYAAPPRGRRAGVVKAAVARPILKPSATSQRADVIEALESVVEQLKPLSESDRRRVLECAASILLPKQ